MLDIQELTNNELLELVNKDLKDNLSVNKICQKYKLGKWTLTNRLNKLGYKYNKDLKQYTKIQDVVEKIKNNNKETLSEITLSNFDTSDQIILKEIDNIKERLDALESKDSSTVTKITVQNTKDTVVKSIRMYKEVKKDLDIYIKKHKNIKVIDIINNAILEYINKNK